MSHYVKSFLAQAPQHFVDRVAAEEEGEGGAPDAGQLLRGDLHQRHTVALDEECAVRRVTDPNRA